jgi:hypothetical protein
MKILELIIGVKVMKVKERMRNYSKLKETLNRHDNEMQTMTLDWILLL